MHPLATVIEIDRLLKEGELSQRKIAVRLGVSRGTVTAIASGRRGLHGQDSRHEDESMRKSPPERCPRCGYFVSLPCLVCRTRDYRDERKVLRIVPASLRPRRAMPSARRSATVRRMRRRQARVA
jgi:hypothetical protein